MKTRMNAKLLGATVVVSVSVGCGPGLALKHTVPGAVIAQLPPEEQKKAQSRQAAVRTAEASWKIALGHRRLARLREDTAEHLLVVADLRVKTVRARAALQRKGGTIFVSQDAMSRAMQLARLARVNQAFRKVTHEYWDWTSRYRARHKLHLEARHHELMVEALHRLKSPQASRFRPSRYIAQSAYWQGEKAKALREVEDRQNRVKRLRPRLVGVWAPSLSCPQKDATRTVQPDAQKTPAPSPKPPVAPPATPKPREDAAPSGTTPPARSGDTSP